MNMREETRRLGPEAVGEPPLSCYWLLLGFTPIEAMPLLCRCEKSRRRLTNSSASGPNPLKSNPPLTPILQSLYPGRGPLPLEKLARLTITKAIAKGAQQK